MNDISKINLKLLVICFAFLFIFLSGNHAFAQTCVDPPSGMIAWWPMDEESGTTVEDIVGNNPGLHVNGPTPAAGMVGGALRFDGSNDYVAVPDRNLWAFGRNDFTIEFWANFDRSGSGSVGHPGDVFIGNDEGPGTSIPSQKF